MGGLERFFFLGILSVPYFFSPFKVFLQFLVSSCIFFQGCFYVLYVVSTLVVELQFVLIILICNLLIVVFHFLKLLFDDLHLVFVSLNLISIECYLHSELFDFLLKLAYFRVFFCKYFFKFIKLLLLNLFFDSLYLLPILLFHFLNRCLELAFFFLKILAFLSN